MKMENGQATALESVRAVVDCLRARQNEIVRAIYDRIREVVPDAEGSRDPAYQAGVLAAVNAVLSYSLDALEHGPGRSARIPPEAAAQARRAARAGVSAAAVLRRYVAGHGCLGEFIAEETAPFRFASDATAVLLLSGTHDALLGQFTAAIEAEYEQEQQRIARSPEQHRVELVRSLLDGETLATAELADLSYRFDAWHIGVITIGASARAALEDLKADHQLLPVFHGEETAWAWLGWQRPPVNTDMDRIRLDREPDVLLAVGEPARGIEGWRQTHQQAQEALHVALLASQPRTRYADIALLTPWLRDPAQGRALVDLYLSPLNSQKDGGVLLRQTLQVYLRGDRNASSAARQLGIDRRTLTHRLHTIEACLGYKLDGRNAELEVALRLHDLLNQAEMHRPVPNPSLGFPTLV